MRNFIKGRLRAFIYARKGLIDLIRNHDPFQAHMIGAILVLSISAFLEFPVWKWITVIFCITIMVMAEAINTAIEYIVDLVSPEYNALAGKAKDVAAAAVTLGLIGTGTIALLLVIF